MTATNAPTGSVPGAARSQAAQPSLRPIEDAYPLTSMQHALLLRCVAFPDQALYIGQWWAVLDGELDKNAFAAAWQGVVDRHTALRSGFHWDLKDQAFQVVHRQASLTLTVIDWQDESDWRQALDVFLAQDRSRPLNIKKPPLMRIALIQLAPTRHIVVWTRHHLTVDGWSLGILLDEVFTLYKAARNDLPQDLPPAPAFRAYVDWEASTNRGAALEYWRGVLANGYPENLPHEPRYAPAQDTSSPDIRSLYVDVPVSAVQGLGRFAQSARVTLNTLMQAAWALVESRIAGHDYALFGAIETIRPPELEQGGNTSLVGVQIQIQPVLARIDDTPLLQWLQGLQEMAAAARDAGLIGMDDFRDLLKRPGNTLPFDSLLGFQNYPLDEAKAFHGTGLILIETGDITLPDMPLNLMVERTATGLRLQLMFDETRHSAASAALRLNMLKVALHALPEASSQAVSSIDVMPAQLIDTLPIDALDQQLAAMKHPSVLELLVRNVESQPNAAAVVHGQQRLTYAQLASHAMGIAYWLAQHGVAQGHRVALHLERAPLAIAAILGIMMRGAAYVPLDLDAPDERKASILEEAGIKVVLSQEPKRIGDFDALCLPDLELRSDAELAADLSSLAFPEDDNEAYVIFTSGSTGRPKGVCITHGNLGYHVAARVNAYPNRPNEVLLLTFPLNFDGSVTGIFGTLATGGALVLPEARVAADPDRLAALIHDEGVTQTIMIPSQWSLLISCGLPKLLQSLKLAVVAGEACPRELVDRHYAALPNTMLSNEYGPTEATVWATVERCDPGQTGPVSIGRPIPGTRAYVVDSRGRRCAPGTVGELLIAGPGIARGYIGRPELTAERFMANPFHDEPHCRTVYRTGDRVSLGFDGKLNFHGRNDDQVKVSGYRIELAEIDATLAGHPGVLESFTRVFRATPDASATIVAHVAGPSLPTRETLLHHIRTRLPGYMVPNHIIFHDALPRNATGKVDRHALPAPKGQEAGTVLPEGEAEQAIATIWQSVLRCPAVGRHDDFFSIGGRSLDAMQVVSRIRRELKLAADLIDLFEAPQLDAFVSRVQGRGTDTSPTIHKRQRNRVDLAATSATAGEAS